MMLTSICSTYWQFLLAQCLAVGVGSGLSLCPSGASIISQYFKDNSALAFGVALLERSIGTSNDFDISEISIVTAPRMFTYYHNHTGG